LFEIAVGHGSKIRRRKIAFTVRYEQRRQCAISNERRQKKKKLGPVRGQATLLNLYQGQALDTLLVHERT
jgi:hypothetical protein